jgi:hypothetical protein
MNRVVIVKNIATIGLLFLLAFLIATPATRADESNQATRVTFSQPVQIPGRVLPAGTYVFELPSDVTQHYLVRIFNADHTALYATIFTISAERQQATGNTAFTFADRGSAGPEAIVTWFYPGDTTGHQFLYPQPVEKELASAKLVTVVAGK